MQEPTTESLSTRIQLWHISTRIYADWSQLLQAIEMWSRSGQNVLWFRINLISDENPAKTTRKNTWWLISSSQVVFKSGSKDFFKHQVPWIPIHPNLIWLITFSHSKNGLRWSKDSSKTKVLDDVWFGSKHKLNYLVCSDPVIADVISCCLHLCRESHLFNAQQWRIDTPTVCVCVWGG